MKPLVESLSALVELGLYALLFTATFHLWRQGSWAKRKGPVQEPELEPGHDHPLVTVQLPLRNEAAVVGSLLEHVTALAWPRDRLEIQVLDDSDDETSALLDRLVDDARTEGARITLLRRGDRHGWKAGNLAHGLTAARGDFIVVLDADAEPEPDLLERLHAALRDHPERAFVQARWRFRNTESVLTCLQSAILDALFTIEQARLGDEGKPVQFNGTAGMWRRSALVDCGGWLPGAASLTEDLDLSLRAEALGLRGCTLPEISVSTELPADMASFVAQQVRWVQGGGLALRSFARRLISSLSTSTLLPFAGHLLRHARQPLLVAAALRLAVVAWHEAHPVCPAWLGPIVLTLATLTMGRYLDAARRRIGARPIAWLGPAMMALSMGLAPRLASAFIGGALGRTGVGFQRTPKGGGTTARRWPSVLEGLVLLASAIAAVGFLESQDVVGLFASMFVAFSVTWVATS